MQFNSATIYSDSAANLVPELMGNLHHNVAAPRLSEDERVCPLALLLHKCSENIIDIGCDIAHGISVVGFVAQPVTTKVDSNHCMTHLAE